MELFTRVTGPTSRRNGPQAKKRKKTRPTIKLIQMDKNIDMLETTESSDFLEIVKSELEDRSYTWHYVSTEE